MLIKEGDIMKKIKKIFITVLSLALIFVIVGCGKSNKVSDNKKNITVTTTFLYDMVNQVAGDKVNVELIIPAGDDPHLYVAKPNDLTKLNSADLVFYHGLHFEGKMIEALDKLNEQGKAVNVSKNFPKDEIGTMKEDGEVVVDPHFWFNINLYKKAVIEVKNALVELLSNEKEDIEKSANLYIQKLDDLDKENKKLLESIPEVSRKLITPHDAFNYFARAYNIEVKAPQGVSTDSEVSTSDINETVDFIVENKVKAIFAESTTDPARMNKLQEAVKRKGFEVKVVSGEGNELFSDSLAQSGEFGDNYIDMYKHNVKLIVDNLK